MKEKPHTSPAKRVTVASLTKPHKKMQPSLRVTLRLMLVAQACTTGQEPPKSEDHTPYSNQGMEDILELNEVVSAIKTEIIPPRSNKTIKAHTPLVLMGTSMNVMMEPLHRTNKALKDCIYAPAMAHTIVALRGQLFSSIVLRTMPLLSRKELLLPEWWPQMRFLRWWWQIAQLEHFKLEDGPGKVV